MASASPQKRRWEETEGTLEVEVRAVSGSILDVFQMSKKDTVYDVKARLDGAPGRHHLLAAEGQVSDAVALGSLAQED
eukprot:s94_g15.t1